MGGQVNLQSLRGELHAAIDRIFDGLESEPNGALPSARGPGAGGSRLAVLAGADNGPWAYSYPAEDIEFESSQWFRITDGGAVHRALLAWTVSKAWGRVRRRAIVFGQIGQDQSTRHPYRRKHGN